MHLLYLLLWFSFFIPKNLLEDFPHLVFASVGRHEKINNLNQIEPVFFIKTFSIIFESYELSACFSIFRIYFKHLSDHFLNLHDCTFKFLKSV